MLTLSPDGKWLWVQERDASRLSVYDTRTFERVARIPVGRTPITNEFTPSGRYTVVTHVGESFVKVLDAGTFREVKTIKVGTNPFGIYLFDPSQGSMAGNR